MKALLIRSVKTGRCYVEVTLPNGSTNLWEGIIEYCSKAFSNNELKNIYVQCNEQLLKLNANDTPLNFKEMLNELRQAVINRKAYK